MRRGALVWISVVAALLVLPNSAPAACTKPHRYKLATGPIPSGETWLVTAGVRNNGSCREWLFDLEFKLGEFGNAGIGTGIPAGGHVPAEYFTLDAQDLLNPNHSEAVFYGLTGREGAKVIATLENGQ